jgi:hypothetical protein
MTLDCMPQELELQASIAVGGQVLPSYTTMRVSKLVPLHVRMM